MLAYAGYFYTQNEEVIHTHKWSKTLIETAVKLQNQGYSSIKIADYLKSNFDFDISDRSVRRKLQCVGKSFERKPNLKISDKLDIKVEKQESIKHTENKDGTITSTIETVIDSEPNMTPEFLLKAHHYDPTKWKIKQSVSNRWSVINAKGTKKFNFQSKIIVEPKVDVDPEQIAKIFNEKIEPLQISSIREGRHSLVVPLFDLHFGITTFDLYRQKLAEIEEIMNHGYKHIVIEQGGDLFHSDFMNKTQTVKGTQLDHVDMVKAIRDAKHFYDEIMRCALANSPRIDVYSVGGNHDFDMDYLFIDALSDRFPQASVHNTNEYRQAYQLDKVGIMLGHGDVGKARDFAMVFATEFKNIWSVTDYHEVHFGHFHKEIVHDDYGTVTRQLGTPKLNDPYEKKNAFVMSSHKLQLFEYGYDRLKATYEI
ncbi:hypothetical protein [Liquorilactobacillus vini]|uniref:hypothetical protein n=1 Tax=Liquorilactobacillus vini TaxID=238015 RepID=UPI0003012A6A|nr:hypothetical protein [Liquorilactobacillus vini]